MNASSAAALVPYPGLMSYGASKAALERMSIDVANQLAADRIACNVFRIDVPVASEGFVANTPGQIAPTGNRVRSRPRESSGCVRQPASFSGRLLSMYELRRDHRHHAVARRAPVPAALRRPSSSRGSSPAARMSSNEDRNEPLMNKVEIGFSPSPRSPTRASTAPTTRWHQLDHMPEQIPLPGVVHGQRWVSTPACQRARTAAVPPLDRVHYVTLYLMTGPEDRVVAGFRNWGERLSELRRFHRHRASHLSGPFLFLKAYAAPRVAISAEAIPYRPCRGIHADRRGSDREAAPRRVGAVARSRRAPRSPRRAGRRRNLDVRRPEPELHDAPTAAASPSRTSTTTPSRSRAVSPSVAEEAERSGRAPDWSGDVRTTYSGPLETIIPWRWDWFDADT